MFFDFEIFYDGEDEQTIKQNKIYRPRKYFEEENFRERFRLDREQFEDFLSQISASLKPINSTNHAMSAKDKLLTALRFYATGSIYAVIGDSHGPSKSSVCRSIRQVTRAINLYMFQRNVGYPDNFGSKFNSLQII
ncbi:unnamed protein product [Meloidogyne enterolobii]|uniref:Uncharacterized protein n=1 Tax=Meloidogyne enterolobii TaxID=390850 RepID=A0ACB0YH45_MELEN